MVLFIFAEKEEYEMILPHIKIIEENVFENLRKFVDSLQ